MSEPQQPPEYLAGAHLFGSASPINFWDTFRLRELDENLDRFVAGGFNAVLLLVPWAQFQHSVSPIRYNQECFRRLDLIFEAARKRNLKIILRIGYLWEPWPSIDPTHQRYREFFMREDIPAAWRAFNAHMHKYAMAKPNFAFAFLSWEDFYWPILIWGGSGQVAHRVERARVSGYRDYVRRRFTLQGLRRLYKLPIESWNDLPIPTAQEPSYEIYMRFYEEEVLARIVAMALEAFPGMRFEYRVDPDWIAVPGGKKFYHWSMNQWGPGSKVVYYHANIGQPSDRNMDTATALKHLELLLHSYTRNLAVGEEKVFIDQFNFFDNTYAKWSRIKSDSVPEFLEKSAELLQKYTLGYAVWGYRDWRKDVLFNGSFELGDEGWRCSGGAAIRSIDPATPDGGSVAHLVAGSALQQDDIILKLGAEDSKRVSLAGEVISSGTIQVELDGVSQEAEVAKGAINLELVFDVKSVGNLSIRSGSAELRLLKVQVYDRVYSQGLVTLDGEPTPASEAMTTLNERLCSR